MSHSTESPQLSVERFDSGAAKKFSSLCFAASVVGLLLSAIGLFNSREQFAYSW
jgi:hypothetical protein